jgi:hypothetical protein
VQCDEIPFPHEAEHPVGEVGVGRPRVAIEVDDRGLPIEAFDADRDGRVSSVEYLAKHRETFLGADTDGDGRTSSQEFGRIQQSMRAGG